VKAHLWALGAAALIAVCAAGAAAGSTAREGKAAAHASKTVTINVYVSGDVNVEDLYTKSLIPGFEKSHPGDKVKLIFSEHGVNDTTTLDRIGAAVKARKWPGIDLVDGGLANTLAIDGLATPMTTAKIPNLAKVQPSLLTPVKGAALPYRGSSVVLAYDSTKVANPPKTLDALIQWIKSNPGKFTYNSPNTGGSGQSFVETVLAKYVSAKDQTAMVNGYVPNLESDWTQGFNLLKSLNSDIYQGVYPNGNQAVLDLLANGQIEMAPVWSDQSLTALEQKQLPSTIHLEQISNPSFTGGGAYVAVPKTAKNKTVVYAFENYMLQPAVQAVVVNAMSGYPAIAIKYLNKSVQSKFSSVSPNTLRPVYSTKMLTDMNAEWQKDVP